MKTDKDDIDPFYLDLLLYTSGELDPKRMAEVEARLANDQEAAAYLDLLRSQGNLLQQEDSDPTPMSFTEAALDQDPESPSNVTFLTRFARPLLAAASALLLGLGITQFMPSPTNGGESTNHFSSRRDDRRQELDQLFKRSRLLASADSQSQWSTYSSRR